MHSRHVTLINTTRGSINHNQNPFRHQQTLARVRSSTCCWAEGDYGLNVHLTQHKCTNTDREQLKWKWHTLSNQARHMSNNCYSCDQQALMTTTTTRMSQLSNNELYTNNNDNVGQGLCYVCTGHNKLNDQWAVSFKGTTASWTHTLCDDH